MFTTLFAIGYLIGLLALGSYYKAASYPRKKKIVSFMYATCICSLVALAVVSSDTPVQVTCSLTASEEQ